MGLKWETQRNVIMDCIAPTNAFRPNATKIPTAADDEAIKNAHNRKESYKWSSRHRLGELILMRQAMECLRSLQNAHFYVNSEEFELAHQGLVAAAVLRGESGLFVRDLPVTMAASGTIQRDCLSKLQ
jgi:hypothetical protein